LASKKLVYDTGTKKIYEGDNEDQLIVTFLDNVLAKDGKTSSRVKGKAINNNLITTQIFEYLSSYNILNHYISKVSDKEMLVRKLESIPLNIVICNGADKKLAQRFGFDNGSALNAPVIELYYQHEKLKDPLVNESHISALGLVTPEEIHLLNRIIAKTNAVLKSFFERRNMFLVEVNLQIGRYRGDLYIGNEISPDTCKFWGIDDEQSYDKNMFRTEKTNASEIYKKVVSQLLGNT
jgi:phosphoribosylaminoimidazole-succinocarboxamide synthase